jgi:putative FmdB family regulatory protein
MPIYEYRCDRGHTFEVMQRMVDNPLTACSTCGAPVQRVFHPVAVHFKGSGFYNTDYGKKKKGAGESGSSTDSSSSDKGEKKKESSGSGSGSQSTSSPKSSDR